MTITWTDARVLSAHELTRLAAALAGTHVFPASSGGAVTPSAGMTIAIAAITANTGLVVNGVIDTTGYAGGTTAIATADTTNPRRDLVWYDGAGGIGSTAGTPAAAPALPTLTAGRIALADVYIAANDTTIDAGDLADRRANVARALYKYKTATQTFSATSAFADVTATAGNMAFPIAASEVWLVEFWLPITYTGTGGLKLQLTGPAAPTAVHISGEFTVNVADAPDSNPSWNQRPFPVATAFSAAVISTNAAAGYGSDLINANQQSLIVLRALIVNGANAGTVTLQGAQNSANGTTVLGIGCHMRAEKIAG